MEKYREKDIWWKSFILETAEDHLGAAENLPGDSVIIKKRGLSSTGKRGGTARL